MSAAFTYPGVYIEIGSGGARPVTLPDEPTLEAR